MNIYELENGLRIVGLIIFIIGFFRFLTWGKGKIDPVGVAQGKIGKSDITVAEAEAEGKRRQTEATRRFIQDNWN
jgi:hypothetical protein